MKKICVLLVFGILLAFAAHAQVGSPRAEGKQFVVGRVDAGTLPVPKPGGIVFDEVQQIFLGSDGGSWSALGTGVSGASTGPSWHTLRDCNFQGGETASLDAGVDGAYDAGFLGNACGLLYCFNCNPNPGPWATGRHPDITPTYGLRFLPSQNAAWHQTTTNSGVFYFKLGESIGPGVTITPYTPLRFTILALDNFTTTGDFLGIGLWTVTGKWQFTGAHKFGGAALTYNTNQFRYSAGGQLVNVGTGVTGNAGVAQFSLVFPNGTISAPGAVVGLNDGGTDFPGGGLWPVAAVDGNNTGMGWSSGDSIANTRIMFTVAREGNVHTGMEVDILRFKIEAYY